MWGSFKLGGLFKSNGSRRSSNEIPDSLDTTATLMQRFEIRVDHITATVFNAVQNGIDQLHYFAGAKEPSEQEESSNHANKQADIKLVAAHRRARSL